MKSWTELCQDNVDHYNDHTATHLITTVVYGVVAIGAVIAMARNAGQSYVKSYTDPK